MKVRLRNPDREVQLEGGRPVSAVLDELGVAVDTVLEAQFFLGYLERGMPLFRSEDRAELRSCEECGQPTTGRFCAFCRARAQIRGERLGADPEPTGREIAEELADEVLPVEIYDRAGR